MSFYINLIICHYYAYAHGCILVHLSVFKCASVGLAFVRIIKTMCAGVPENYVITCDSKVDKKDNLFLTVIIYKYQHVERK